MGLYRHFVFVISIELSCHYYIIVNRYVSFFMLQLTIMKPVCESRKYKSLINSREIYKEDSPLSNASELKLNEIDFTYSPNSINCARNFDNCTNIFNHFDCDNCFRYIPDQDLCDKLCTFCSSDDGLYKWGCLNDIHPGNVPPELMNLTYLEQMLISRVHPVVGLYRIRGA